MADDVTFQASTPATPAAGVVIATDNIGGVNYQRVKVTWGADGVATDTSTSAPLPITRVASATGALTNVGVGTTATALPSSPLTGRTLVRVSNPATPYGYPTPIYIGYSNAVTTGVSAANNAGGRILAPGQTIDFAVQSGQALYGITTTQTQVIQVEELT